MMAGSELNASPEARSFSARDRRVIRTCFADHASDLPPGLARREQLPPGPERQMERNATLPAGLQKRVQALPQVCESQLGSLPRDLERVVYNRGTPTATNPKTQKAVAPTGLGAAPAPISTEDDPRQSLVDWMTASLAE